MNAQLNNKRHPLAGKRMTGAEMMIHVLAQEGVDTIFGYTGGAILPTYDAIFRYNVEHESKPSEQIQLIVPANEQGAGFMAAGYARASGKVGVFIVTSGPAATNSVTPIRDSMADSVPVVLICGQVARNAIGTDAFQEAPVFNLMSSCAKHVFLVEEPEDLECIVRTAFEIARSGRPGPVVIDVPKDVQNWEGTFKGEGIYRFRGYENRMKALADARLTQNECRDFFELLQQCERPLICAGGGIICGDAAEQLRTFSRRFQIPVVTTLMGIGSVDTTDKLSLHMLGMHGMAYANYAVMDCDFLITVGARFDDRVAGKVQEYAPRARYFAHIDIDAAEIGKVKSVTWFHVGSAREALTDLMHSGGEFGKDFSKWLDHVDNLKKNHVRNYDRESTAIQPPYVIECLNEITRGEAIICTGVGQHQMWAAQYLEVKNPRSFLTSGSMGTMGFGLPASIGAQMACPDCLVIDIDGDGSMRMNLGELETATTYNLPIKVLVLNNQGDGMVRQWQKIYFGNRFSGSDKSLRLKDFIKTAEADGFEFAARVADKNQLKKTLTEFVQFKGPAFLEVMIDPDACVYPMVGPGMGYKEMITGDFIVGRDPVENLADGPSKLTDSF
ncbi:MAG TPA: biosynthetic-type acetolactate synthase large subunit [Acidobacteriota bacterium]|nr:biosynthetic-type acetolactate synthase large subunit [Acidobacteriota bacterium]